MLAQSSGGSSYAGSVASSKSSSSRRAKADKEHDSGSGGEDLWDKHSTFENGIFGVLFTLSKENSETRIRIRWVLLKVFLDTWQLFTTVVSPDQGWHIDANGAAWTVVGVLNFTWLADLGYTAYVAVLYCMVALLAINVGMCVWVAWCFKEHKFPVVWPIKVLRVFSSVFFQAFDVASLNLLQLGFTCRFTGPTKPHLHFALFPEYSCAKAPHILHAIVSGLCLVLFVAIALLLNMAEVEVNLKSRRPLALGHSGAEVTAFAIKVLLTLVNVVFGWKRVAACFYLVLALALAYQYLRWNPNLVAWMNYLKAGGVVAIVWCTIIGVFLVFEPGVKDDGVDKFQLNMTITMLAGLAPAFGAGALMSWAILRHMTAVTLKALANAKPEMPLEEICDNLDEPRDVEIVARCCRVWKDRHTLEPDAVNKAHHVIKAGMAMFPSSAYMHLLHANFMIDVLGVAQSGSSRLEDARKLNPGLMSRFVMFVRQQQATQKDAGKNATDGASMDLLGYVEYQRKQRMVVRLHRDALQAMCNFWKALDAHTVSFTHLSKALAKIDTSVSEAQAAYRVVLESYSSNPKLVRLYGKFLQTIKNDPWGASEYFADAERLEEAKNGDNGGPLLPDGTPLGRMDEMDVAVLVLNSTGEIQMANRQTHTLFGYKRGNLEGKPMSSLLAPHFGRRLGDELSGLVSTSGMAAALDDEEGEITRNDVVLGMHCERLAFPVKLTLRRASGIGEDSTIIALMESVPPLKGVASLWVAPSGTIAACDPQFVANFGWKATEVNGATITALLSVRFPSDSEGAGPSTTRITQSASETMRKLLSTSKVGSQDGSNEHGLSCMVAHKYDNMPTPCTICVVESDIADTPVYELRIKLVASDPTELLAVNRKGVVLHATLQLAVNLKDAVGAAARGNLLGNHPHHHDAEGELVHHHHHATMGAFAPASDLLEGYTLHDFMPPPWKDMHVKYLKEITAMSAPGRGQWTCRKAGGPGTTMELRTSTGKTTYMQVAVTTSEIGGEMTHVVRVARSSLEAALDERRLRLSISEEGLIEGVSKGAAAHLLGLEPMQVIGRDFWEVIHEEEEGEGEPLAASAGDSAARSARLTELFKRSFTHAECSWRVRVAVPPPKPKNGGTGAAAAGLAGAPWAAGGSSPPKHAIMQVFMELPSSQADADAAPVMYVDLWPTTSVTGVVELDASGRVSSVLEELTRPAGLLFGVPTQSLVGSMLSGLVTLPPGRSNPSELLSLHGAKKSSLKADNKEASVKVGPLHVLQAAHSDGRPLVLDVQMVGRPGPNQPVTAILRVHAAPMMPAAATTMLKTRDSAVSAVAAISIGVAGTSATAERLILPSAEQESSCLANLATATVFPTRYTSQSLPPSGKRAETSSPRKMSHGSVDGGPTNGSPKRPTLDSASILTTPIISTPPTAEPCLPTRGSLEVTKAAEEVSPDTKKSIVVTSARLLTGMGDGLPQPGVTAGKNASAQQAGRTKLSELVKAAVGQGGAGGGGAGGSSVCGSLRVRSVSAAAAGGAKGVKAMFVPRLQRRSDDQSSLPGTVTTGAADHTEGAITWTSQTLVEVRSVGDSDLEDDAPLKYKLSDVASRITTWVASEGAYYQNTVPVPVEDVDKDQRDYMGSSKKAMGTAPGEAAFSPAKRQTSSVRPADSGTPRSNAAAFQGLEGGAQDDDDGRAEEPGGEADRGGFDDGASEGGQSGMSSQSGTGGPEFKRGKRLKKLVKLLSSDDVVQVQRRFRNRTLFTLAALALVHVLCFALAVRAIKSQRRSMANLGDLGQTQRYIHQIVTDVRVLDLMERNMTQPNLYTADQAQFFLDRVQMAAAEYKARINTILSEHHASSSTITQLLRFTKTKVWDGYAPDGTDVWTNMTIWEYATQFCVLANEISFTYNQTYGTPTTIQGTYTGEFLLRSGPDLYKANRKMLDALLDIAIAETKKMDTLQLIFLAVEGAVVTCMAACYLAHLLHVLAAQRCKLYGTFLTVPVALSRTLASQNTAVILEEDDEENMSDDDEPAAGAPSGPNATDTSDEYTPASGGGGGGGVRGSPSAAAASKTKRHATLKVVPDSNDPSNRSRGSNGGGGRTATYANGHNNGLSGRVHSVSRLDGSVRGGKAGSERGNREQQQQEEERLMGASESMDAASPGLLSSTLVQLLKGFQWRGQQGAMPLPQTSRLGEVGNSKRRLKYDSNETYMLLLPFVIWSTLVVAIYAFTVIKMKGVVEEVAIHSVTNIASARVWRVIFFSQELAITDPPLVSNTSATLVSSVQLLKDAWYTLQLGENAYKAAGPDTEKFSHVTLGLAEASPALTGEFYNNGLCHRIFEPCPGPDYRFYLTIYGGLDSIMQQFMLKAMAMARDENVTVKGLANDNLDFIYNVGGKDLVEGTIHIQTSHFSTIMSIFTDILSLHIILFVMLWVIFGGFIFLLLRPLLKRVSKERRRIAELINQLPLELDVERLVSRALAATQPGSNSATNSVGVGSTGAVGETAGGYSGIRVDSEFTVFTKKQPTGKGLRA